MRPKCCKILIEKLLEIAKHYAHLLWPRSKELKKKPEPKTTSDLLQNPEKTQFLGTKAAKHLRKRKTVLMSVKPL